MVEQESEIIYQRIDLDYELKDLEPYIPEKIMNDHYNGNHRGYENGLNSTLAKLDKYQREYIKNSCLELKNLLRNLNQLARELALSPQLPTASRFGAEPGRSRTRDQPQRCRELPGQGGNSGLGR